MSPYRWFPIAVGLALASPALAAPLTFQQALDQAVASAPNLRATALQVEAAQSASRAAGALPDPKLGVSLENLPISGPTAGRLGADSMTMARVGFTQDIPSAARRRADVAVAHAAIGEAEAKSIVEARGVKVATAMAWIDLAYAERRLAALDGVLASLEPIWAAQPSAVASGRARPAEALRPVQMRASLEDERNELTAALERARAELTRWTGEPSPSAAGQFPSFAVDAVALRAGLDANPTLLAYRAAGARAEAELQTARAARKPDWSWEVAYGRRDPMFGDMVSVGVSVSLPLFKGSRQEPIVMARQADASRVLAERENARRALAAQLDADLADHVMHHEQWMRTTTVVLPSIQQRADLETASYGAGTADLSDVLEAMTALAEIKLTALEREAAVTRDGARIALTYGSQP